VRRGTRIVSQPQFTIDEVHIGFRSAIAKGKR
jgi:hypothetical protein